MRYGFAAVFVVCAGMSATAQAVGHEFRPELVLTSPRVNGFGLQLLWEQHLEGSEFEPIEKIRGVGVSGPLFGHFRPVIEVREVKQPLQEEHRFIPSLFSTFTLPNEFELRSRTR